MAVHTGRWAHYREAVIIPLRRTAAYVFIDLLGAVLTWRDFLFSDDLQTRLHLDKLPTWSWGWWAVLTGGLVVAVVLEASYRIRLKSEGELNQALRRLTELAEERAIQFEQIALDTRGSSLPLLMRIGIVFRNNSDKLIEYKFEDTRVFVNENEEPTRDDRPDGVIHGKQTLTHWVDLVHSGMLGPGMARIEVRFDVKYDNRPPLKQRQAGRDLIQTVPKPGTDAEWIDVKILDEREY